MSKLKIGLTGGIGSGKTTVANIFASYGIELVDADIIARQVVEPGSAGLQAITERYGSEILMPDTSLNRRALREVVFADSEERQWLNGLLHPLIREQMLIQMEQATSAYVILVVPLLFENGLDSLVNQSVLVDIPPSLQVKRTAARDQVDALQVQSIIDSQMSREDKLSKADYVVDNQGELGQLEAQVMQLHKQFLQQAKLSSN